MKIQLQTKSRWLRKWGAVQGPDPNYTMQKIINGDFDTELTQWAIDAANTNIPLLVEFGAEVNGNWFPWNGQYNGAGETTGYGDTNLPDGPERFRDAYRHIIDICNTNGANNITCFFILIHTVNQILVGIILRTIIQEIVILIGSV